jgi:flagellar basal body-associated protein FliL
MALKMKRSKTMIALLLPVIVCVFVLGWVMYWFGGNYEPVKSKPVKIVPMEVAVVEQ